MDSIYFAITGLNNYYSSKILKPGMIVKLEKDYNNDYDDEAIAVTLPYLGKVGYVANSVGTVPRGCYSAGRLYDKFGSYAYAAVKFVGKDFAIAEFLEDDFIKITIKFKLKEKRRKKHKNKA
ncbi:MAG: hypothetical protein XD49_0438 [Caldanaerobacter subterraneus]|jgi:hypothetical protein|uniref:HIRAN domain-containing protein n=4 Tax=Caldanaerobacter subterraneus TaxID=911092 RepID=Q8R942_CALS4|nr:MULTISPECIES: HIRAN domain-containing protein [Caldanaerobacter]AAM24979.1 hypothetical protein TTE1785 [Caldanaerobacter subterraneus subsp. tengcongensis MB4]ERM93190.1 HIRAN domain-containing protein [Caldanaerobacter subterraneus subsp. yonseiensis KB-1]KKC29332.1 hypothetical protein CDSM653_01651 [Caldanaerobacter subterraneus subsp. pacificus DSM 12653]KUK09481.1 MAG: hypothetical protein XD49_0438 [Caldanaerobacter subterraneus]MCS3915440.1 hypothetical protein [Caldanaerobacter sub